MRDIFFPIKKKKVLRACPAANEVFNGGRINIYTRRGVFSPRAESRLHPNTYVTVRNDISSIAVFMKRSYAEWFPSRGNKFLARLALNAWRDDVFSNFPLAEFSSALIFQ